MFNRSLRAAATAALCAILAACASGLERPSLLPVESAALMAPETPPRAAATPAALPQGPLTLEEAVNTALQRNPNLRAAAKRIGQAEARIGEAASAFWPTVVARVSYLRTTNPGQAFGMIVSQRQYAMTLDPNRPGTTDNLRPEIAGYLPLYRGNQRLNNVQAAKYGMEAARSEETALRNLLVESVTDAYYAHLAATESVEVARVSVEAVESELAEARKRHEAGALLKSDVLSLEVRLAAAREGRVRARNAVEQIRSALRLLLGLAEEERLELDASVPERKRTTVKTLSEAVGKAFSTRPEVRAAASVLQMREHELSAARGARHPRVDLFGSYGTDSDELHFSREQDNWTFGLVMELDLFTGFRTHEQVRFAKHRLSEARAQQKAVYDQVQHEVRIAWLALEEAEERVKVTEKSVAAAEEALRLVREQYQAGTVTVTRYLEAEAAQADAQSRGIAARYDVRRAEAKIRKAIGLGG